MLRIERFTGDHIPAVRAFNQRLREGGMELHRSPESPDCQLPLRGNHNEQWAEKFVAVDGEYVHGSYTLIHNRFRLGGEIHDVPFLQLPLSEGAVNPKYGSVGLALLQDVFHRAPLVYGLGMGGMDRPLPRLLKILGAQLRPVPFYFRVCRAGRFLRRMPPLRRSPLRRLAADIAAFSLLGALGVGLVNAWNARRMPRASSVQAETVQRFEAWCDEIWFSASGNYSFAAVRDAQTLNYLYGDSASPFIRLRISVGGRPIGWAVVLAAPLKESHNYFPGMTLGSIVDCFALPGNEPAVVMAASRFLQHQKVDLIVSNQMAQVWRDAMRVCGYMSYQSNMIFAAPKGLWSELRKADPELKAAHLTRGDGDGPYNLY